MKQRSIDLQLIKPVQPGSSGAKGKITLKQLFKEQLDELNVAVSDCICPSAISTLRYNNGEIEFYNESTKTWEIIVVTGGEPSGFTPGAVLFGDADTTIGEDPTQLFYDNTNNRLGVGTNAPARAIDVRADIDINGHRIGRGNSNLQTSIVFGEGAGALHSGANGVIIGQNAAPILTTGGNMVVIGQGAFTGSTSGRDSVIIGQGALTGAANLWGNVYIGFLAGFNNSVSALSQNRYGSVVVGQGAGYNGGQNRSVAVGTSALQTATTDGLVSYDGSVAIGDRALFNVGAATGSNARFNTAVGLHAGHCITLGYSNTAIGAGAMGSSSPAYGGAAAALVGSNNIAVGLQAGFALTGTATRNIFIGSNAGQSLTTENNNVIIGGNNGASLVGLSDHILIADGDGTERLLINSSGAYSIGGGFGNVGEVLTSNGNAAAPTWQPVTLSVTEGTYTPTLTGVANVSASTPYLFNYVRVGDRIHVFGEIDIDPTTTATLTQLGIELPPVTSGVANTFDVAGTAADDLGTVARIRGDVVNGRAELRMTPTDITNRTFSVHFSFLYTAL